jgi:hypothetical protein
MSNNAKLRFTIVLSAVMGYAASASAAHPPVATVSAAQIAASHCVPGMTAATPGGCLLPGFHWAHTTDSTGHNSVDRSVWMLLPNQ